MNINHHNYESYFIDYIDGILTLEDVNEVYAFLLLNNDLRQQLECLSEVKLQVPNIAYRQKAMLQKDELHECTDYYPIATVEYLLTIHDKEFVRKHPVSKEDIALYQKIKLTCDPRVIYPNKTQLYRRQKLYLTIVLRYISAAMIIFLVGLTYLFYSQQTERVEIPIAQTIVNPYNQGIESKKSVISFTIKECTATLSIPETQKRIELSLMELSYSSILELPSVEPDYSLIPQYSASLSAKLPEMYLTEAAHTWKGYRIHFIADNIINSMRNTGRSISLRLKIRYFINNNSDVYASY